MMRDVDGVVTYYNPKDCLRNCQMILDELGDSWVILFDEGDEPSPLGLCTGGQHAHESWQEYRDCYAKLQEKYTLRKELHVIRGSKTNKLCRVCADIFADHAEAQCPVGPGSENPSLLKLWDNPVGDFVRFIGVMVEHVKGVQMGPCPLCNVQEEQHDYTACLQTANVELKEGELNVTTSRRKHGDPPPDPNPMGPTPGTTPKTMQPVPASIERISFNEQLGRAVSISLAMCSCTYDNISSSSTISYYCILNGLIGVRLSK